MRNAEFSDYSMPTYIRKDHDAVASGSCAVCEPPCTGKASALLTFDRVDEFCDACAEMRRTKRCRHLGFASAAAVASAMVLL